MALSKNGRHSACIKAIQIYTSGLATALRARAVRTAAVQRPEADGGHDKCAREHHLMHGVAPVAQRLGSGAHGGDKHRGAGIPEHAGFEVWLCGALRGRGGAGPARREERGTL